MCDPVRLDIRTSERRPSGWAEHPRRRGGANLHQAWGARLCGDASIRPLLLARTSFLQVVRFPPAAFHWLNLNQTVWPLGTEPASALSKPNTCSTLPMATTAVACRT